MRIHGVFRGIGSFAVKFRWFVLVAWIIAAVAVPRALPSLSSVTQGNNANFLPASAPSEHALKLAGPLGGSTLTPVPVVAASAQGTLTQAEQAWLQKLQQDLGKVPTVVKVRDLGHSPDGQAAQLQVLSNVSQGGSGTGVTTLVKDLRNTIARDGPPPGLSVHLAGAIPIQVDQQNKSGGTDSQIQLLSIIFIIGLLLLVFRALLAPLVTLIPAVFAVTISGPLVAEAAHHGLKVSPLAQILLIVLVLGAGTDYGLFLVFRVRENLRQGQDRKQAVIAAVERVGESITFSAATVIAALLSLLFATFEFYSNLGIPLAIGIAVMLLAGLTLLPALLAIFGRAVFWPSKTQQGTGKAGVWGRVSARIVRHPVPTLVVGLVVFGGLAFAVTAYTAAGFGGDTTAPGGLRLGGRRRDPRRPLPEHVGQPDEHHLPAQAARVERPAGPRDGPEPARGQRAVHHGGRAAEPERRDAHAGPAHRPARQARAAAAAACYPAARHEHLAARLPAVPRDRSVHQPGRPDGPVRDRPQGG